MPILSDPYNNTNKVVIFFTERNSTYSVLPKETTFLYTPAVFRNLQSGPPLVSVPFPEGDQVKVSEERLLLFARALKRNQVYVCLQMPLFEGFSVTDRFMANVENYLTDRNVITCTELLVEEYLEKTEIPPVSIAMIHYSSINHSKYYI